MALGLQTSVSSGAQTGYFDIMAEWVETLHGQGKLTNSLESLVKTLRADAALLQRSQVGRLSMKNVATADRLAQKVLSTRRRSFVQDILGDDLLSMKRGSTLSLSEAIQDGMIDRDTLTNLRTQLSAHNVRDIVITRLSADQNTSDFLEVHFGGEVSEADRNLLSILAPTLAKTWASRLPGTVEKEIARCQIRSIHSTPDPSQVSILDVSNPLELSRCEYRICMLVKEGMLVKTIAKTLAVQDSTVRAHLRSIYLKTGTSCHVELLHRLTMEDSASASFLAPAAEVEHDYLRPTG